MRFLFLAVLLPAALLSSAGCGRSGLAPVSGRITLNGKPLAGAHVAFQPIGADAGESAGFGSYAVTDADGRYQLKCMKDDAAGAALGKHRVSISTLGEEQSTVQDVPDAAGAKPGQEVVLPKDKVPERYNIETELVFEVTSSGSDKADFELKSP